MCRGLVTTARLNITQPTDLISKKEKNKEQNHNQKTKEGKQNATSTSTTRNKI